MKRAGVFSLYWDTLGGGEKYVASVAQYLSSQGYEVSIWWKDERLLDDIKKRYGYSLAGVTVGVDGYRILTAGGWWSKRRLMRQFDLVFYLSDGSLPWLFGKNNILHFQVPFHGVGGSSLLNILKLRRMDSVVCNSEFTKRVIDSEFKIDSEVLYPPAEMVKPQKKEKIILSVGRFDNLLHSKRQDVLIRVFERMKVRDWKLVIAGGVLHGDKQVENLKSSHTSDDIELRVNPNHNELTKLYAKATIFWHAAGFGHDLQKYPEKAEHFGMATVEAMSAGAVPVVFGGGGQVEIIDDGENGILWATEQELEAKTLSLINDEPGLNRMSENAKKRSRRFSRKEFERGFKELIG